MWEHNHTVSCSTYHFSLNFLTFKPLNSMQNVQCFPKPDALNPCEDVMGFKWLRVSVWIGNEIFLL